MNLLRKYLLLLVVALVLPLTACEKSDEPQPEPLPESTEHTLICYFMGFDLNYFFFQNIDMIKAALRTLSLEDTTLQDKVRVVCIFQQGNKDKTALMELEFHKGVCESKEIQVYDLPERTESETITFFVGEAIKQAPARTYGLVLGGHSRAWTPIDFSSSISQDRPHLQSPKTIADHQLWLRPEKHMMTRFFGDPPQTTDTYYSCIEIADLARGLEATGVKFEYTIYDACFMANVESLYELRNTTKYAIGSVSEIMGAGFPYKRVIPHLLGTGGKSFDLDAVCRDYHEHYAVEVGYSGCASLIDMRQMDALAEAFKRVRSTGIVEGVTLSAFQCYDGLSKPLFLDLGDYVKLVAEDEAAEEAFMTQLSKTVISRYHTDKFYAGWGANKGMKPVYADQYFGLSTSYPSDFYRDEYYQTSWYKATE